jgi:hypothetical protein
MYVESSFIIWYVTVVSFTAHALKWNLKTFFCSYFNNLGLLKKPNYYSRNRKKQFHQVVHVLAFLFNHLLTNIRYFRWDFEVSGRYLRHQRSYTFYRTSFQYGLNVFLRFFTCLKFPFVSFMGKLLFKVQFK